MLLSRESAISDVIAIPKIHITALYHKLSSTLKWKQKMVCLNNNSDLLVEQNLLILKLLYHGATYKNLTNEKGFKWNAIDILNSFIDTKK